MLAPSMTAAGRPGAGISQLDCIPEGACRFAAEGRMASIGPSAFGAKGCVEGGIASLRGKASVGAF